MTAAADMLTTATPERTSTYAEYHALPGARWSALNRLRVSPLYYLAHEESDASHFREGRAFHSLVLGGEPVVRCDVRRVGKAWEEFQAAHEGAIILSPAEHATHWGMAEGLDRSAPWRAIRERISHREQIVQWTEGERTAKAMLDVCTHDGQLVDVKTARDVSPRAFGRAAGALGYHCQLAWYRRGYRARFGCSPSECLLVAVQKSPPYDVAVYRVTDSQLMVADIEIDKLLATLTKCEASGEWPGCSPEIADLELPAYAFDSAGLAEASLEGLGV